jgi:hypothetical protein
LKKTLYLFRTLRHVIIIVYNQPIDWKDNQEVIGGFYGVLFSVLFSVLFCKGSTAFVVGVLTLSRLWKSSGAGEVTSSEVIFVLWTSCSRDAITVGIPLLLRRCASRASTSGPGGLQKRSRRLRANWAR